MMDYLPVFLDMKGRRALMVGGGATATRKADLLCRAGARVRLVAPSITDALRARAGTDTLELIERVFRDDDLRGVSLVIAATNDRGLNRHVSELARLQRVPVNVVDDPELCSFIMPAIVDRSPLMIAISSGGAAPVLARLVREKLEAALPEGYRRLARMAAALRGDVKARFKDLTARRRFWEGVFSGPLAERVMNATEEQGKSLVYDALMTGDMRVSSLGEVYLVGAGPGDPELLTFRALRLMQQADVVVYDRLVAPAVMDKVRRDADRIYVGKAANRHTLPQEDINRILVEQASQGRRVVRLKGGDPFVFGRGGEEIETLKAAGIPFQVVPGITAALGCAAYSGIPLTHRDCAHGCLFVTGHMKDGALSLPWPSMVQPNQTVVVYMGLGALPLLADGLIRHGLSEDWPVALIQDGTSEQQRVVTGTLSTIAAQAKAAELISPTLVIIGEVVRLRQQLSWYRNTEEAPVARVAGTA